LALAPYLNPSTIPRFPLTPPKCRRSDNLDNFLQYEIFLAEISVIRRILHPLFMMSEYACKTTSLFRLWKDHYHLQ
jgi:hypothetical protein